MQRMATSSRRQSLCEDMNSAWGEIFASQAEKWDTNENSLEFAQFMDDKDPLKEFRKLFHYPKKKTLPKVDLDLLESEDEEAIYFCGHSLGLPLKSIECYLSKVYEDWSRSGVYSHFNGTLPAAFCDLPLKEKMGRVVGAHEDEIVIMNGLTVNIHVMLATFYRPTAERHKILLTAQGFPSDLFAVRSQIRFHGFDPEDSLIFLTPKENEYILSPNEIQSVIEKEGTSIALIFLEGVHYYTGQLLDMKHITEMGHNQGCTVGFDLAHAAGNAELQLHDWNVDFAVWCTYKYMNSGAGSSASVFVHNKFTQNVITNSLPMLQGWWGVDPRFKFAMKREFNPAEGADRFKLSNPSPFLAAMVYANLEVFDEAGINRLTEKQRYLTGYLEYLIKESFPENGHKNVLISIITPSNPKQRGCQLSLLSSVPLTVVEGELKKRGVVCDVRQPAVIRVAPVPLYNTFTEVFNFVRVLKQVFDDFAPNGLEQDR